jgi:TolB-like protein/Tfp pilus assembly protein PilF/predicted Ser/Thr protein kinase
MPLNTHGRLGAFEIVALLGAGGMGEVYRARDTRLDREVALKVLPAATLGDETARARLLREARLASKINHPHVCTIHEVGEADGRVFIAMELIEGEPLSALAGAGALPAEQVLRYGLQVADALAHAHERGIIHRDLKSANVVITREGRAKVLDFGLAKQVPGEEWATATTASNDMFTAPGMVAGTLTYMAPEQLRGLPADARSDIWALGIVLYEMAAGTRPFQGRTGFEVSSAILGQAPPPLPPAVPAPLAAVIERCLAKEPAQRYQRAGEVRAALETVQSGGPVTRQPAKSARPRWRWAVGVAALASLVAVLAGLDIGGVRSRLLGGGRGALRMAVLPFVNQTGDPEQEYLSDGVTDEMIAQLGRLDPRSLEVIARTSVMRYKKSNTPIDQIGRELQVDFVLEGSARRGGSRIRISAVLIRVRGQTQLWADSYEREMSDILALQSDVARQVAGALALKLLPAEQARLAKVRRVDPEAYEAYLKGTHYRQSLTKGGFETAERYFTLALEKDPSYAAAWAGLARVWTGRQQMGITPPREAFREAKAAALKALVLDETEWEAHRALAGILTWGDWDWPAAERKWKQILELNPNSAEALQGYSHFLMHMGRPDEAMASIERALLLDPFSVRNQSFYAADLVYARRYDDAIAAARAALRLQPDAPVAMNALYQALFLTGRYDEALALDRENYAGDRELREALERGYADRGYAGAQKRLTDVWAARVGKPGGVRAWDLAVRCLCAGDRERALQWLERAYDDRDGNMPYIGMPIYDTLRSDPRFQDLLRRMKLPH